MSILEVTAVPFSAAFRGGGERYPAVLAAELSRSEEVVVSFAGPPPIGNPRIPTLSVPGRHWNAPPFLTPANPLPTLRGIARIRGYLHDHRSDVEFVHVHNLRTAYGTTWVVLSKLQKSGGRFQILLTDHAARFSPWPRVTASMVDYYVAVSNESLRQLNGWARRPGFVLPPPVPEPFLQGPPLPAHAERDIDLLFLGRVVPWKRPDKVLTLARMIEDHSGDSVRVTVAGSALDESYWENLRRDAARAGLRGGASFVHRPTDNQVVELYSRAKVFVLLSMQRDSEGHRYSTAELAPATIAEAAARGTPAVVSDLPGVDEQVESGVRGFVVNPERLESVVEPVSRLLGDREEWSRFSAAAREFATRDRSAGAFGRRMSGILAEIRRGTS